MAAKDLEKAEQQGLLEFFKLTTKINTSNMICFDYEQKIKRYDSAEDILEDFYPIRLIYYQKRKVRMFLNGTCGFIDLRIGLPRIRTANGFGEADEPSTVCSDDHR